MLQTLLVLLSFIVGHVVILYFQLNRFVTLLLSALLLLIASWLLPVWLVYLLWASWLMVLLLCFIYPLRSLILTRPLMTWLAQRLPRLSPAERELISTGDVYWESELFSGKPNWSQLLAEPKMQLTETEQAFIDNQVNTLCAMLDEWQVAIETQNLPQPAWEYLKQEKFWGMIISEEYGGLGFSALAHSVVVAKLSSRCYGAAISVMVPNSLGPAEFIMHYGTKAQKAYYLPRLATGAEIPCFALTSTNAGSDAASINDSGVICESEYQGKTVIGIKLNFDKRYITLAPVATLMGLVFKLYDPDHLIGDNTEVGITIALVPTQLPGVVRGLRHRPMNNGFLNGPIAGKDVFIPLDYVIGGREQCGQAWRMLTECLAVGRSISLPAQVTGVGKMLFRATSAYVQLREQFKLPLGQFEGICHPLARIGGFTYLADAARLLTLQGIGNQLRPAIASAITKYHLTELARRMINDAIDIHGGRGVQIGPSNYLFGYYLAAPIAITIEGANILTRNLIVFGQGVFRCHPYLKDELELLADEQAPSRQRRFDRLLGKHLWHTLVSMSRAIVDGLSGARWVKVPDTSRLSSYLQQLSRMSNVLLFITDITLLVLGGQLKRKENVSARLGDILSHLYMASAVVRYYEQRGQTDAELPFARWALDYCLYRVQHAIDALLHNYPKSWLARVIRWVAFPLGACYPMASDQLSWQVAQAMQEDESVRDRLTRDLYYYSTDPQEALGRIEYTMQQLHNVKPLLEKLRQAVKASPALAMDNNISKQITAAVAAGVIDAHEQELLLAFVKQQQDAMRVDDFELNE